MFVEGTLNLLQESRELTGYHAIAVGYEFIAWGQLASRNRDEGSR